MVHAIDQQPVSLVGHPRRGRRRRDLGKLLAAESLVVERAIAWIEVAKLREHRLGDASGALAATRAARRLLERSRATGRPYPRVEADLLRRGARLATRIRRDASAARKSKA